MRFRSNESTWAACLHATIFADPLLWDVRSSCMKGYFKGSRSVVFVFDSTAVLYTLCSCCVLYTTLSEVLIFFPSQVSPVWGTTWTYCLNVLSLSCLQMQECEKDLKFVVFDMYIPWLVSSASIKDCLCKKVHLKSGWTTAFRILFFIVVCK